LLDLNEAVVELVEPVAGLAEKTAYLVKTLVDVLEASVVHVKPASHTAQPFVMLANERDEDVDALASLCDVSGLLLPLPLLVRHNGRLLGWVGRQAGNARRRAITPLRSC
jgi:hypothetical protein